MKQEILNKDIILKNLGQGNLSEALILIVKSKETEYISEHIV